MFRRETCWDWYILRPERSWRHWANGSSAKICGPRKILRTIISICCSPMRPAWMPLTRQSKNIIRHWSIAIRTAKTWPSSSWKRCYPWIQSSSGHISFWHCSIWTANSGTVQRENCISAWILTAIILWRSVIWRKWRRSWPRMRTANRPAGVKRMMRCATRVITRSSYNRWM